MIRMYVRHPVQDYAAWRKAYEDFDSQRVQMGVTAHGVFQSIDDPNDVTVWHDFNTADEAKAFVASEDLRNAMKEAGVAGEPAIWFVTNAD